MNQDRVAFFKDRYSRLSDEELANLLIGRHECLSEEANNALTQVLEQKNPAEFMREVREKVEDLNSQALAAAKRVEHQEERNRQSWRGMAILLVATVVIFSVVALLRSM